MLKFYALQGRYMNAKLAAASYEYKDGKFVFYYSEIHDLNDEFNSDVNNFARECYNIYKYHDFFENAIDEMFSLSNVANVLSVLKAIDSILMLTLRILEFKLSIDGMVQNAKTYLNNLKDYRFKIITQIEKIEQLTSYYSNGLDIKKVEVQKSHVGIKGMILSLFLLLIF